MKSLQQQLQEAYLGMKGILSEEDEQVVSDILALDELSKKTLGSYIKKATVATADHAHKSRDTVSRDEDGRAKEFGKAVKRIKGVSKAVDKLTKEEFEETLDEMLELLDEEALTELSKKTLGSYINKASKVAATDARDIGNITGLKLRAAETKKVNKRLSNITKATSRLTKEQKELIGSILEELQAEFEETLDESVKVGDHVHVGHMVKGGSGVKGKVTKIDGDTVHIEEIGSTSKFGPKTFRGSLKNTSKV